MQTTRGDRFPELDTLRACAVMLVLWTHTAGTTVGVGSFRLGGYHGVLLFFVISGFLITGILLNARAAAEQHGTSRKAVLGAFYVRRFLRIFPIYYLVLTLAAVMGVPTVREAIAWHVAYLSNWYFAWRGKFDVPTAHLWSLAVEEQFYLFWPWFALSLPRRALSWVIGVMILTGPLSRLAIRGMGVRHWPTGSRRQRCSMPWAWVACWRMRGGRPTRQLV